MAAVAPVGPETSGLAIASLVLGIIGLVGIPLIPPILAVVFGHVALGRIRASNGQITGRELAIVGVVLGWVGVAISIVVALAIALVVIA
jgi:hypothetical protein